MRVLDLYSVKSLYKREPRGNFSPVGNFPLLVRTPTRVISGFVSLYIRLDGQRISISAISRNGLEDSNTTAAVAVQ
jgi:hypothetical protein